MAVTFVGCSSESAGGPSTGSGAADATGQPGACAVDYGSCSKAEVDSFLKCVGGRCGDKYAVCYGSGYASGVFSGPCGEVATCQNACACDDTACQKACAPKQTLECVTCLGPVGQCVQAECGFPMCMAPPNDGGVAGAFDSGVATGTKTCVDLTACCASLADASKRETCNKQYDAVKGFGDTYCNSVYQSYALQGLCK